MLSRVVVPPTISAGTQSNSTGTIVFSNSNGFTFGMSNSSIVTASYTVPTVPAQFSGGNSNLGNTAGDTGVFTGRLVLVGTDNITLSGSSNGGSATISIVGNTAGGLTNIRLSAGTTSNLLSAVTFADSNGISFGIDASTITASHNGLTSQSNQNVTAANGGFAFQTLSFSNVNGVSFGTSAGSAITASIATSLTNIRLSAGTTSNLASAFTFADSNGISFGLDASTITATYYRPVVSNAIQAVGSATGSGTNTSRFAADDHVHAGVFSMGVSTGGNTSGDTRVDVGRFVLAGGNNITLSQATAANGLNTITISAGAGGAGMSAGLSNIGNTSGDTGAVTGRLILAGGNNITLSGSTNGGSMTITVSAPNLGAGAFSGGASNLGNTAGDTGITGTRLVFVGTNGASLSQATDANGGTLTINALKTQSLYAVGNTVGTSSGTADLRTLSISFAGGVSGAASDSGWVVSRPVLKYWDVYPFGAGANTAITGVYVAGFGTGTSTALLLYPFVLPDYVAAEFCGMIMSQSFSTNSNSSGRQSAGMHYGLFTRQTGANSSVLSLLTSASFGWSVTGNNSTYTIHYPTTTNSAGFTTGSTSSAGSNVSSQFTGAALIAFPVGLTLTPGHYWFGVVQTQSTTSNVVGIHQSIWGFNLGSTMLNLRPFGSLSSAHTGTAADGGFGGPWRYGNGSWSTAGLNSIPNSLGINSITKPGGSILPFLKFWTTP